MKNDLILALFRKILDTGDIALIDKVLARRPGEGVLVVTVGGQPMKYIGNGMVQSLTGGVLGLSNIGEVESVSVCNRNVPVDDDYAGMQSPDILSSLKKEKSSKNSGTEAVPTPLDLKLFGKR